MTLTQRGGQRPLTPGEIAMVRHVFGTSIDPDPVRLHRRKWIFFQPRETAMAPDGAIWLHPDGNLWQEDFSAAPLSAQGLFIHEMTHVWQAQRGGRWFLPLMRHPFCRYAYDYVPGRRFGRYGLEQQAEIVRHAFLLAKGVCLADRPPLATYCALLPFTGNLRPMAEAAKTGSSVR